MGTEGGIRDTAGAPFSTGFDKTTGEVAARFPSPVVFACDVLLFFPDVATSYPPEIAVIDGTAGSHRMAV